MNYLTEFQIQQLRTKNLTAAVEAIVVVLGAVIANSLIPQLLLKYVYDPTVLLEAPPVFEYLPLVTYTLGLLYVLYVLFTNFTRNRRIRTLEQELMLTGGGCCSDGSCCHDDEEITEEELKELERIVDEALKPEKKSAAKSKKSAKSKTTKKKSTKKSK